MGKSCELLEHPKANKTTTWPVKASVMVQKLIGCDNGQSAAKPSQEWEESSETRVNDPNACVMGYETPRVHDISFKEMVI